MEKTDDKKCDIFSLAVVVVAAPFFFTAQWAFLRMEGQTIQVGYGLS